VRFDAPIGSTSAQTLDRSPPSMMPEGDLTPAIMLEFEK
jgi:hypothetical protein